MFVRWFLITFFFFFASPPPEFYTLSLHDALPIYVRHWRARWPRLAADRARALRDRALLSCLGGDSCRARTRAVRRSEEHTSELQSRENLVCRLLLEKKKQHFGTAFSTIVRPIDAL